MLSLKTSGVMFSIAVAFLLMWVAVATMMTGCATTGVEQKPQISPERQKAIQDSLRKVYEFELNKSWSLGFENYKNKMYKDALRHFWRVAELDTIKRFPTLYRYLGDSYIKLQKPDSAEIVYRIATEKYPDNPFYHRSLGWLLTGKHENDQAIKEYQKAIELDSIPRPDDYRALGNLLVQEDRQEEAIEVYKKLVELEPDNAEAQSVLAQLLQATGQEDEALEAQESALKKDPKNTKLMYSLGEAYFKRSEFQKAVEKFEMYLKYKPEDVFALEYLGNSLQNLGEFRKAIGVYEKILAIQPDNKKAYCEMATCYRELGNFPKARSIVRKALKIDPNYGLAHIVLGEIYEDTADNCINKRAKKIVNFDDKLVYEMAYKEYQKATKDIQFADEARKKMSYVQPDIPTKEDRFMHPNQTKARLDCYKWIY